MSALMVRARGVGFRVARSRSHESLDTPGKNRRPDNPGLRREQAAHGLRPSEWSW